MFDLARVASFFSLMSGKNEVNAIEPLTPPESALTLGDVISNPQNRPGVSQRRRPFPDHKFFSTGAGPPLLSARFL